MLTSRLYATCKRTALVATIALGIAVSYPPLTNLSANSPSCNDGANIASNTAPNADTVNDNAGGSAADTSNNA